MQKTDPITNHAVNCIPVARASAGLYLIFKTEGLHTGMDVLYPANICYAAIYPAMYAKGHPVFCDVNPLDGNASYESFLAALTPQTKFAVIPHMYGNPVKDMPLIAAECKKRGIILIEDCASAMGICPPHYQAGSMGDYAIYSTGYSKTLDFGYGGLVTSSRDLSCMEQMERQLAPLDLKMEESDGLFSKLYRQIRNQDVWNPLAQAVFKTFYDTCQNAFVHRLDDSLKEELLSKLDRLPETIDKRRQSWKQYEKAINNPNIQIMPMHEGAVPWRFCIFVSHKLRQSIIDQCLDKGLPVSDWYPVVTPLFGDLSSFENAKWHEEHILNFPLPADLQTIHEIAAVLNSQSA